MTITVLPMDATAGVPAYSAKNARQAQAPLYGNPTGRVFGTRSGWRVGTLSSIVSVTSTTWTLNPCSCMIEPAAQLYQGAYGWASDAVVTGSVTPADGTNPRIDILYIQVNDSSSGDGSGGLSAPVSYLAGDPAPAGTQVAKPLPPRSFLVATIAVPKSGAGSPTVTFNSTYFVASGGLLPVFSQAERDSLTQYLGLRVARLDIGPTAVDCSDGTKWTLTGVSRHAEFTGAGTAVAANTSWGPGVLTRDATASVNDGFATIDSADCISLNEPGTYILDAFVKFAAVPYPGFLGWRNKSESVVFSENGMASGAGQSQNATHACTIQVTSAPVVVRLRIWQGSAINVTGSRYRITKVG